MRAKTNIDSGFVKAKPANSIICEVGSDKEGYIKFVYTLPADNKRKGYIIKIKEGGYPENADDGVTVYDDQNARRDKVTFTYPKTGFADGTTYYVRIFTYTYKNADIVYTYKNAPQCIVTPVQLKGTMVMTVSDTYIIPNNVGNIDLFLVGGGAGGTAYGGGGGGYTKTIKGINVSSTKEIVASIGAGGRSGTSTAGGATTVIINGITYKANGADENNASKAGNGGSGGGGSSTGSTSMVGGSGGTNGSDGVSGSEGSANYSKGTGQGSSTHAFEDETMELYAGGGGGGAICYLSNGDNYSFSYGRGQGGAGGGGMGGATFYTGVAESIYATDGTDGTGGGGGSGNTLSTGNPGGSGNGGSGVAIIRWGY